MTLELGIWTLDNNYHSTLQMTLLMQNLLRAMLVSDYKFSHRKPLILLHVTGQHFGT